MLAELLAAAWPCLVPAAVEAWLLVLLLWALLLRPRWLLNHPPPLHRCWSLQKAAESAANNHAKHSKHVGWLYAMASKV